MLRRAVYSFIIITTSSTTIAIWGWTIMRRIATITRLKPDAIAEYKKLHDEIWDEVVEAAHQANLRNYTIFCSGDYLFSYYEYIGDSYELDMQKKNSIPIVQLWQKTTGVCLMESPKIVMDEIWHGNF